jgi:hypothetical protein
MILACSDFRVSNTSVSPGVNEDALIVVESLVAAAVDPPPATLTWLTCGEPALAATFTVTLIRE